MKMRLIRPGLVLLAVLAGIAATWPPVLSAQSPDATTVEIRVCDWWTYARKDAITGQPIDSFTSAVTDVSPTEIATRADFGRPERAAIVVFDHDWNRIRNGSLNYKPNDGHGVSLPLAVGKERRIEFEVRNVQNGASNKGVNLSKVAAQETLTTPAATFETFRIERQVRQVNTADPSRSIEIAMVLWFAPQINHWVRRTVLTKMQKRTRDNTSDDLTAFGRKQ